MKHKADFGQWNSPITPEWITRSQKKFNHIVLEGGSVYWDEVRPEERGRSVIVEKTAGGKIIEHTPPEMSARTRVHEYGGLAFAVSKGNVYFVNDKDQRIYLKNQALTEAGIRCADLHIAGNYLVGVGEKGKENFLFSLHLPTKKLNKIASGHDFYSSPTFSPDGKKIAFLTWDLPNMPWDGTELWVADWVDGEIVSPQKMAGGASESIFQPQWSPQGVIHYVSDRTGWWNIYRDNTPIHPLESEFGMPAWLFGMSTYAFAGDQIVACFTSGGVWKLCLLEPYKELILPYTFFTQIRSSFEKCYFIAASATMDRTVIEYGLKSGQTEVIARNPVLHLDPETVSTPELMTFPSKGGRKAHAVYYAPKNKEWEAPPGKLPPLLIFLHGGPTSQAPAIFDLKIQFWTTRGFAVADVNYGGSTGYGRAYRDALKDKWGIVDVEDCEAAALFLIAQGKVDPQRIAIRGGSAGGYTTLAALTFTETFTVGASYYGVSDLNALVEETHKFESRYIDTLIGPYPQAKKIYQERSPLFNVDKLKSPVIFFQGAEDLVVPASQAQMMHDALKKKKIQTELIIYPEEQHGFRKGETIKDSLLRELDFYNNVWNKK